MRTQTISVGLSDEVYTHPTVIAFAGILHHATAWWLARHLGLTRQHSASHAVGFIACLYGTFPLHGPREQRILGVTGGSRPRHSPRPTHRFGNRGGTTCFVLGGELWPSGPTILPRAECPQAFYRRAVSSCSLKALLTSLAVLSVFASFPLRLAIFASTSLPVTS